MIYIIGLGSNIPSKYGDKLQTLKFAMLELEKNNIKILKKSYLYSSAPQNFLSAADNFINAAIMVETIQKPLILLNCLKKIEGMTGRNAYKQNTSRTCDLDILMVKPATLYLDVIHLLKQNSDLPIAAYNVSGECSMLMAAAEKGYLNYEAAMQEMLLSIARAGADVILTYFAKDYAKLMKG